jgi:hypothetical protein
LQCTTTGRRHAGEAAEASDFDKRLKPLEVSHAAG